MKFLTSDEMCSKDFVIDVDGLSCNINVMATPYNIILFDLFLKSSYYDKDAFHIYLDEFNSLVKETNNDS